jgi:hypothetical protein
MKRSMVTAVLIAATRPLPALAVEARHQGAAATSPGAGQLAEGEVNGACSVMGKEAVR